MMNLLIGFLTVVLVLDCLFLILLILIQLPKKEAGAGIAFGGAATDALFGAGSGTALTKITKYCAGLFLGLALFLSILNAHHGPGSDRSLTNKLMQKASGAQPVVPTLTPTNTLTGAAAPASSPLLSTTNSAVATNPVATNPPQPAPKE
jgi:preprotein translocase subunit SecG